MSNTKTEKPWWDIFSLFTPSPETTPQQPNNGSNGSNSSTQVQVNNKNNNTIVRKNTRLNENVKMPVAPTMNAEVSKKLNEISQQLEVLFDELRQQSLREAVYAKDIKKYENISKKRKNHTIGALDSLQELLKRVSNTMDENPENRAMVFQMIREKLQKNRGVIATTPENNKLMGISQKELEQEPKNVSFNLRKNTKLNMGTCQDATPEREEELETLYKQLLLMPYYVSEDDPTLQGIMQEIPNRDMRVKQMNTNGVRINLNGLNEKEKLELVKTYLVDTIKMVARMQKMRNFGTKCPRRKMKKIRDGIQQLIRSVDDALQQQRPHNNQREPQREPQRDNRRDNMREERTFEKPKRNNNKNSSFVNETMNLVVPPSIPTLGNVVITRNSNVNLTK